MITFILIGFVAIVAIALVMLAWNSGARKRMNQSETPSTEVSAGEPKVGRASGPD